MLQFPTYGAYDNAIRVIGRKGRLYKLDRVCCSIYTLAKRKGKKKLSSFVFTWKMFDFFTLFIGIRLIVLNGTSLLHTTEEL